MDFATIKRLKDGWQEDSSMRAVAPSPVAIMFAERVVKEVSTLTPIPLFCGGIFLEGEAVGVEIYNDLQVVVVRETSEVEFDTPSPQEVIEEVTR